MRLSNPLDDRTNPAADTCEDCGAAIHGDDNASAFGDNLNVCDDCESKRETEAKSGGAK
jgi:ribosome-binding protein aMBF1 (putative translation factor)